MKGEMEAAMDASTLDADLRYCASSFLMYRTVPRKNKCFTKALPIRRFERGNVETVMSSEDLERALSRQVQAACANGRAALALSGGIDSAVLAKMMPAGSVAYTFRCVVPGVEVVDESSRAALYAAECGLEHRIVEIGWDDVEQFAPKLMMTKGAPIHSIEVQIYKAALQAKADGFDALIFGESADCNYGGLSGVLSRDWTIGEYIDRYCFVLPYKVLKEWDMDVSHFEPFVDKNGYVDVHEHFRRFFFVESMGSYENAMTLAGLNFVAPYANTWMGVPLDYGRVRAGENKYLVREIFNRLYPNWEVPVKTPMPRPTEEWLKSWDGPVRPEFWPHCTDRMTGDQKWLVWSLEKFLNTIEEAALI